MNLQTLNLLAGAAHAAAALAVTIAFRNQPPSQRTVTLVRDAIDTESTTPLNGCTSVDFPLVAKPEHVVDPRSVLQFYFGVSAVAHGFYALDPGGVYSSAVRAGNNPFRWPEYALSAGSMMYLVSALDGNRNANATLMAAGAVGALNLLGNTTEGLLQQGPRHDYFTACPRGRKPPRVPTGPLLSATLTAWLLLVLAFYTVISAFRNQLEDVKSVPDAPQPPSWLTYVIFSQLLWFCAFGSVQVMQLGELVGQERAMARFKPVSVKDFEHYERIYIALSLGAKLTLGGFVSYGLLRRTGDCAP